MGLLHEGEVILLEGGVFSGAYVVSKCKHFDKFLQAPSYFIACATISSKVKKVLLYSLYCIFSFLYKHICGPLT